MNRNINKKNFAPIQSKVSPACRQESDPFDGCQARR